MLPPDVGSPTWVPWLYAIAGCFLGIAITRAFYRALYRTRRRETIDE